MYEFQCTRRPRRSVLFLGSTVIALVACGCGASPAIEGNVNPNDILPATAINANPDDFKVTATETEEPGRWQFSVTRLGEPAATDGLSFAWDFGEAANGSGTETTHAFEEPGRHVIIVTAKTADGTVAFLLTLEIDIAPFNRTPKAIVGPDQTVDGNASVFLDGSESFDADGDEISFFWRQVSGPSVFLTGVREPIASFVTPTIDRDAQLLFKLEVSDEGHTGEATTTVNVTDLLNPAGFNPGATPLCTFTVALEGTTALGQLDTVRPLTVNATASTVSGDLPTDGSYTWMFDGVTDSGIVTTKRTSSRVFNTAGVHTIALALTVGGITVGCHSVQSGTTEAQVVVWPAISGKVVSPAGDAVPGVTVSAGAGGTTAVTDAKGEFHVNVPYRWTGTVTVQHTDFAFDTAQVSFANVQTDVANQGFVARPRGGVNPPPGGSANLAPFADAGSNQMLLDANNNGFELVSLDGSNSTDSDGTIVDFAWSENGTQRGLGDRVNTILGVGSHSITLTVIDDEGATATDSVLIVVTSPTTAQNDPPVASAGPDQSVEDTDASGSELVTLDGSGSSDTDGTIASYEWFVAATMIATGPSPTIDFSVGVHTVTLVVTDDFGAPAQDVATVTVTAPPPQNLPPIADAGSDFTVEDLDESGSEPVSVDGRSSRDPDGTIVAYRWLEGGATLYSGVNPTATLTFSLGTHDLTLRVTDDQNTTDDDTVRITVATPTPPGTFYVDTNNPLASDAGPGTEALPFKTIQKAADLVNPGDTVYVKGGTYAATSGYQTVYIHQVNGSPNNPITFQAFVQPDGHHDNVMIDGSSKTRTWGMRIAASSYVIIDGFTFANHRDSGCSIGRGFPDGTDVLNAPSHHITIRNCLSHDNGLQNTWFGGFEVVGPSHDIVFKRCESHHNGRGFFWGQSHQTDPTVLPYNITATYCLAHHNTLSPNNSDGFTTSGVHDVLLSHCVSHDNSADGITEQGPYADNNVWEYCVAFNGNSLNIPDGDGNGFKIGNINSILANQGYVGSKNHIVRHCISFNNRNRGFEDTEGATGSKYYNNVAFGNNYWGFLTESRAGKYAVTAIATPGLVGCTLRNNVGFHNADGTYPGGGDNRFQGIYGDAAMFGAGAAYTDSVTHLVGNNGSPVHSSDYNFWSDLAVASTFTNSTITSDDGLVVESHSLAGDPLFISSSPTVDTNLYIGDPALRIPNPDFGIVLGLALRQASPCVDAGTDVGDSAPPFDGNGDSQAVYDMGVYEFRAP